MTIHLWLQLVLKSVVHALNQWPVNGFSHGQNGWSKKQRVGVVPLTVTLTVTLEKNVTSFPAILSFAGFEIKGEMLPSEDTMCHWIGSWTDDVAIGGSLWLGKTGKEGSYHVPWDDRSWMWRARGLLLCNGYVYNYITIYVTVLHVYIMYSIYYDMFYIL